MRAAAAACVVLFACSDPAPVAIDAAGDAAPMADVPVAACTAAGGGVINGSVGGAQVAPVVTAKVARFAGEHVIVFAETLGPNLCNAPMSTYGDALNIFMCTTAVGTHSIDLDSPMCPGSNAGAHFLVSSSSTTTVVRATAGMLQIESADAACVAGTFSMTFETGDMITGSLAASVCP